MIKFLEFVLSVWKTCQTCGGSGQVNKKTCPACGGAGGIDTKTI